MVFRLGKLFKNVFRRGEGAAGEPTSSPFSPREGIFLDADYFPSPGAALSIATVYRCVSLLSKSVANLPFEYLRRKNGVFEPMTDDYLYYLLTVQPDKTYNAFDFWRDAVSELLLTGNAYIVPVYSPTSMSVERLVLCSRGSVMHDTLHDIYTVNDAVNGLSGTYGEDEVIHLKGKSIDGKSGMSVLHYARMTLTIARAGDAETSNRFKNGGNVSGLLSNDRSVTGLGEYQDKELDKAAIDVDAQFRSGRRIVSLPGMVDFKQITMSSADLQFLESRKFTVREICRFFGVHPSFVFDDTSNNYKSAEMANVAFLSTTLNPILRQIELEFLRKLVSPRLVGNRKFAFDRRALYACDLESKAKYQADTIATGLYTVNEWRKEENKRPVDGGDVVLVSANLKSIKDTGVHSWGDMK